MTAEENRIKSLELEVEEQRRDYDVLHGLHEALKVKNLTFLATGFGLLGYLFSGTDSNSLKVKLFIPNQPYGVVIYTAGLILTLAAILGFILVIIRREAWHTAYDNDIESRMEDKHSNYEKYLRHTNERYLEISKSNSRCYDRKSLLLNNSFIILVVGGTILLIIKSFGG